jgi:peptidoglycan biosynthesis protein MviN/MurJ (putative lipid II flippase)
MVGGTAAYLSLLAKGSVSVWFIAWALRRRYELDEKLGWREQTLRWSAIAVAFAVALLGGSDLAAVRIIAWIVATLFLAWPNLAFHLTARINQLRTPKQPDEL